MNLCHMWVYETACAMDERLESFIQKLNFQNVFPNYNLFNAGSNSIYSKNYEKNYVRFYVRFVRFVAFQSLSKLLKDLVTVKMYQITNQDNLSNVSDK